MGEVSFLRQRFSSRSRVLWQDGGVTLHVRDPPAARRKRRESVSCPAHPPLSFVFPSSFLFLFCVFFVRRCESADIKAINWQLRRARRDPILIECVSPIANPPSPPPILKGEETKASVCNLGVSPAPRRPP